MPEQVTLTPHRARTALKTRAPYPASVKDPLTDDEDSLLAYPELVTDTRRLVLLAGIFAAVAGVVSGTGALLLVIYAATDSTFPFGAALLVFAGAPFLLVGITLAATAAVEHRGAEQATLTGVRRPHRG